MLSDRLAHVHERIRQACLRSRRDPASVRLIVVTKGVAADVIRQAVSLGVTDLGENRVQEAREKRQVVDAPNVRWHLIGHLQRNKARLAAGLFDVIHSADSSAVIESLGHAGRPLDVLIQVNVSGEASKFGCPPASARSLAEAVSRTPGLTLAGLMTIAPFSEDPEQARPHFRRLRQLRDELLESGSLRPGACGLSMGMSQDFEVAIEEGADTVRIGTAIFGPRV